MADKAQSGSDTTFYATTDYFDDTDGNKAFKAESLRSSGNNNVNHADDDTAGYFKVFFLDPATGVRYYAQNVLSSVNANQYVATIFPGDTSTNYNDGLPIQMWFDRNLIKNTMDDNDKIVFYHQANSPDMHTSDNIKNPSFYGDAVNHEYMTVSIDLHTQSDTKEYGNKRSVEVFWDLDDPGRTEFTALTLVNGEFNK